MERHPYASEGGIIKQYRIAANITQSDVSNDLGIPIGTYRMYEQGRCRPSAGRLAAIMVRLDIPASALTGELETVA